MPNQRPTPVVISIPEWFHCHFSVPHTGQNLWFTYDSIEDLKQLVNNLHPQGIRESALKSKLQEVFPELTQAFAPQPSKK